MANDWALGIATASLPPGVAPVDRLRDQRPDATLLGHLAHAVQEINATYFRFAVDGLGEPEEPILVKVECATSTADLGLGLCSPRTTRKLTVLVALDPVTVRVAGRLGADVSIEQGHLAVIPAYAVATLIPDGPVGTAHLLAMHAVGNAFQ